MPFSHIVDLEVPSCATHARSELLARWGARLAMLVLGLALTAVFAPPTAVLSGIVVIGLTVGGVLWRVTHLPRRRWSDWVGLGVYAEELSVERRAVTLRVRSPAVRDQLARPRT